LGDNGPGFELMLSSCKSSDERTPPLIIQFTAFTGSRGEQTTKGDPESIINTTFIRRREVGKNKGTILEI
jgi:hypothetical protein